MPERRTKEEWLEYIQRHTDELRTRAGELVLFSGSEPDPRTQLGKVYASLQARAIVGPNAMGFTTIRETPLGQKLDAAQLNHELSSGLKREDAQEVWGLASRELARHASGNVTVVLHPDATSKHVFFREELPALLANDRVTSINGIPREQLRDQPLAVTRPLVQERAPAVSFNQEALQERIRRQHAETERHRQRVQRSQDLEQERDL